MRKDNKQFGFSLMEAIIYLTIVGILLTAVVSLHLTLGGTQSKLTSNILTSRNRRMSLGAIDYLVQNSSGLWKDLEDYCSDFNSEPPVLALYFEDDTHLPGTCVENGGGVTITVSNKRLVLTCYPNIIGNGYYDVCNTTTYPAGNIYYLSSPEVEVLDSSLAFSTSTSSSTLNNYLALSTNLTINTPYSEQVKLAATSTATSTVVLKNEKASGLIAWWDINEYDLGLYDKLGLNEPGCYVNDPTRATPLVPGNDAAEYWNDGSESCYILAPYRLSFNQGFTLALWLAETSSGANRQVFGVSNYTDAGWYFTIDNGRPELRIADGTGNFSEYYASSGSAMTASTTYHVAVTYDRPNGKIVFYIYQKGVGGYSTTTYTSSDIQLIYPGFSLGTFAYDDDGSMTTSFLGATDEFRVYERPLSAQEVWALQSQGYD